LLEYIRLCSFGFYLYETDDIDILINPVVENSQIKSFEWYWINYKNKEYKKNKKYKKGEVFSNEIELVLKEIKDWENKFYKDE
jgi:hypothetical protein